MLFCGFPWMVVHGNTAIQQYLYHGHLRFRRCTCPWYPKHIQTSRTWCLLPKQPGSQGIVITRRSSHQIMNSSLRYQVCITVNKSQAPWGADMDVNQYETAKKWFGEHPKDQSVHLGQVHHRGFDPQPYCSKNIFTTFGPTTLRLRTHGRISTRGSSWRRRQRGLHKIGADYRWVRKSRYQLAKLSWL